MLVYGDPGRTIDVETWRDSLARPLVSSPWIEAHAELTSRLIDTGQVLQALEDLAFESAGEQDRQLSELRPLCRYLLELARAVAASWSTQRVAGLLPATAPEPPRFAPRRLRVREPEGYGFYALYPEAFFEAARRLAPLEGAVVIGLRSIGASLAPMVAAGLGASDFVTLRPKGSPFAREIDAPDLAALLSCTSVRNVAIVDEGPGLSGSSFAATARFVRASNASCEIHLFPSHPHGPGHEADHESRTLFRTARTHLVSFDDLASGRLATWIEDLTGRVHGAPHDVSGGTWRERMYASEADWPAVDPMQERRKFHIEAERGSFLLKFIGLGRIGERKAALAHALAQASLAPEVFGFRHGFLVERWRGEARPADPLRDRPKLLPALARYLAFRRSRFIAHDDFGASLSDLRAMAVRNASLTLGPAAGERAGAALDAARPFEGAMRPIATDNRVHAHEWLVTPDGHVLKTDGVDHHAGHDLIGAQDVSYDIAAASEAWALTPQETEHICRRIEAQSGCRVERGLLHPMRVAWLAFETGRISLAARSNAGSPEEGRLEARAAALTRRLGHALSRAESSTIRELQSQPVVWPT